jgi:hypothetical protein
MKNKQKFQIPKTSYPTVLQVCLKFTNKMQHVSFHYWKQNLLGL